MDSIVGKEVKIEKGKKKAKKEMDWILRYSISHNAVYWCSKKKIKGKFQYRIYRDLKPGGMGPPKYYEGDPDKKKKKLEYEKKLCFASAYLYYVRDEEKQAGIQRTDCDLSDVEDYDDDVPDRKNNIKKMLEKIKKDRSTGKNFFYPDPNQLITQEMKY